MYTSDIFETPLESIFFQDSKLYVALAYDSLANGHSVIVWKDNVEDLNLLSSNDYEYLMDVVDVTRATLKEYYLVEKVYLMYMDETKQVHWHLIPRYSNQGINALNHEPVKLADFSDVSKLKDIFTKNHYKMIVEN